MYCTFTSAGTRFGSASATSKAAAVRSSKSDIARPEFQQRADFVRRRRAARDQWEHVNDFIQIVLAAFSFKTRNTIACAAATNVFSFNVVSACNGVLERTRRGHEFRPMAHQTPRALEKAGSVSSKCKARAGNGPRPCFPAN